MIQHHFVPFHGPEAARDDVGVLPEFRLQRFTRVGRAGKADGQRANQCVVEVADHLKDRVANDALQAKSVQDGPLQPLSSSDGRVHVQRIAVHRQPEQQGLVRAAPFFTCTMSPEDGTWLVENVATRPEARRRGFVARLLPPILEQGRRRGFTRAQLTCFLGNHGAQLAYERAGFRVVSEKRHPDFEAAIGCPGLARMECPL